MNTIEKNQLIELIAEWIRMIIVSTYPKTDSQTMITSVAKTRSWLQGRDIHTLRGMSGPARVGLARMGHPS